MVKLLKSGVLIIITTFLLSYGLILLAVFLAGALFFKLAFFLFLAFLISFLVGGVILGGFFTSLSNYLFNSRRIFRLDNLSHPLLLRLSREAPGTYHHSILVANLAAKAAKAIGADSLLVRVAAYFHDIGKLKNPGFFIENQNHQSDKDGQSLRESSQKSVRKILEHIKEGVAMASEAPLPKEVVNLISQHHGTSLCSYFYQMAREKNPANLRRSDFRYPGPKPQTKEAAILMLADSLEARLRANGSNSSIREIVEEDFTDKIAEKQLTECQLSQKEIRKLKEVFAETFESMFHPRIEYPKKTKIS